MLNQTKLASLVVLAIFSSACSMKSNLDDMHAKTGEMNQTTNKMLGTTENMAITTEKMSGTTEDMKDLSVSLEQNTQSLLTLARLKETEETRQRQLEDMEKYSDDLGKVAGAAGVYFMSQEYQLWTGLQGDTEEYREVLFESSIREFNRDLTPYLAGFQTEVVLTDVKADNQILMGFSLAMHELNYFQEKYSDKFGFKKVSILDLVKDGLTSGYKLSKGEIAVEDLKSTQKEVLHLQKEYTELLIYRLNTFGTLVLNKLKKISAETIPLYTQKWTVNLDDLNLVQQEDIIRYLKGAIDTKVFLKSIEVDTTLSFSIVQSEMLNLSLLDALKNMDIISTTKESPTSKAAEKNLVEIKNLLAFYLSV